VVGHALTVTDLPTEIRQACAHVADRARQVTIATDTIPAYAAALPLAEPDFDPAAHLQTGTPERLAAFWLTLDAINFGSGWFPTLRKLPGRSGYFTIATGIRERFDAVGAWSADELATISAPEIADVVGQDPAHELMALFAASLNDLGGHIGTDAGGSFEALVDGADGSAIALVNRLSAWDCFADVSTYDGHPVPFYKRAQITASDLQRAGLLEAPDRERLTLFADNLVPHVLRLDGILRFESGLVERIDREQLIEHGSPEEVEIRACALQAVELIVAARAATGNPTCAAVVDEFLWSRGQQPHYKASPRHRSRCTEY
jgi:hypothetical protein